MRHSEDGELYVILAIFIGTSISGYWYIFQKLYLKCFCRELDSEKKEIKAVTKEVEVTNVLNLQQDAVIIFSTEDDKRHPANDSEG